MLVIVNDESSSQHQVVISHTSEMIVSLAVHDFVVWIILACFTLILLVTLGFLVGLFP